MFHTLVNKTKFTDQKNCTDHLIKNTFIYRLLLTIFKKRQISRPVSGFTYQLSTMQISKLNYRYLVGLLFNLCWFLFFELLFPFLANLMFLKNFGSTSLRYQMFLVIEDTITVISFWKFKTIRGGKRLFWQVDLIL